MRANNQSINQSINQACKQTNKQTNKPVVGEEVASGRGAVVDWNAACGECLKSLFGNVILLPDRGFRDVWV